MISLTERANKNKDFFEVPITFGGQTYSNNNDES